MLRPWDLQIIINTDCERPVYIQIADAIISAIKAGKLNSGDALPGSRQLATKLKVNRNTIIEALDVLLAEEWLVSKERKGTFVADSLPTFSAAKRDVQEPLKKALATKPEIVFDDGLPDTRIAPITELAGAYRQIFNQKGRWQLMGYSHSSGDHTFRSAIVQMLNYKRGMRLSPDEIFITRGSQMAMYLSAHCLLQPGDRVIVENPGYKPAWLAFENAGASLLPVGVDADGIIIDDVKAYLRRYKSIKAIYITPHHQFPTTVTLSLQRRLELIALSNKYGFTIIEDDYDNEFHFGQRPILPVSSFENVENYVYIGTMSKIVAPALRIGYLASSQALINKISQLRKIIDVQGDNIMAQAILQLINDGHIKRHLKKATLLYRNKRDLFETLINEHLVDKVHFHKPEGGLAFWLKPKRPVDPDNISKELMKKGVQIISPREFSFGDPVNGLRLGYASLNESQLEQGVKALSLLL
ncbi:PLP-dependent aminotransferase family protein [Chitinophaga sp. S165]|uniref:MocR-like pyridoxine biosynthesis transcription factor PdxR n=1 Tax=Chitinophaga sp. S165 TaxID=2135462 RepID=UPI000D70E9A0|nr:PLP-dependent aminotransferase family protein [Chitinophaga sp. S165]PWV54326.1 GntR family transcriptional regulator/MocR family aminotransferase [Chitinophaga sp. S165]